MDANSNNASRADRGALVGAGEQMAQNGTSNALTVSEPNGFDWAIQCLKKGHAVKRAGWNGRGMCIFLNKGSVDFRPNDTIPPRIDGVPRALFENGDHGTVTRLPNLNMRTASGSTVTGWLASQTDILAEDWQFA